MKIKNIIRGDKNQVAVDDLQNITAYFQNQPGRQLLLTNIEVAAMTIDGSATTVLMEAASHGRLQLVQLLTNGITQIDLQNLVTTRNDSGMNVLNYASSHQATLNYIGNLMMNLNVAGAAVPVMQTDYEAF